MTRYFAAAAFAALLAGAAPAAPAAHLLEAAFDKYDADKDGLLDPAELAKAFRGPKAKPVEHKEGAKPHDETKHLDQAMLDVYDADKDGKISKAEFEKYEQKLVSEAKARAAAQSRLSRHRRTRR